MLLLLRQLSGEHINCDMAIDVTELCLIHA